MENRHQKVVKTQTLIYYDMEESENKVYMKDYHGKYEGYLL